MSRITNKPNTAAPTAASTTVNRFALACVLALCSLWLLDAAAQDRQLTIPDTRPAIQPNSAQTVTASGFRVKLLRQVLLGFDRVGTISDLDLHEGKHVKQGEVIAKLDDEVAVAALNSAHKKSTNSVHRRYAEASYAVSKNEHEQAQLEKPAPTTLVDIPAIDVTPGPSTPADPIQPGVFAPSIVTVIESIQALKATQAQRYWSSDCNRLQVEVGLRDCEPKDRNNYALLKRNRTYEALNPVRQLTRTQRSLSVVSRQALALAAELEAGTIEPGLAEYLVQEIEAGITQLADPGNRAVKNMGRMDTSAAAVMKRRILQDPWVQSRTKQLQQRRVHTN